MTRVGIIAEYNPFHSGHEFLLNQARLTAGNDPIIVVMSGNYVQRGEMAIMDKWHRAKAALNSGADLVFELPFSTALQAADRFAYGGVKLLAALGAQELFFGVEDSNLDFSYLGQKIAQIPRDHLQFSDYSQTYSTQYNQMVAKEVGREINQPNSILGLAYAVANYQLGQPLQLHPITRLGAGHDSDLRRNQVIQSATAIRNLLYQQPDFDQLKAWIPKQELADLKAIKSYPSWDLLFPFLKYRLESASLEELRQIYQMSEGLEYKLKEEIHQAQTFLDFLRHIKSKRYTYSRLRRLCLFTLLNVTQQDMEKAQAGKELMLLGYNKLGRRYLHQIKKQLPLNLISRVDKKNALLDDLALQIRVDRLYEQVCGHDQNFGQKPVEG
jgi:predicted nucleotidyltransferase